MRASKCHTPASGGAVCFCTSTKQQMESYFLLAIRCSDSRQVHSARQCPPSPKYEPNAMGRTHYGPYLALKKISGAPLLGTGMLSLLGVSAQERRGWRSSGWLGTLTLSPS